MIFKKDVERRGKMKKIGFSIDAEYILDLFKNKQKGFQLINAIKNLGISHLEFYNFKYGAYGEGLTIYTEVFKQISKIIGVSLHFSPFARISGSNLRETWKWRSRLNNFILFAYNVNAFWVNMHMGEVDKCFDGDFIKEFCESLFKIICRNNLAGIQMPLTIENSFQGYLQRGIEYGISSKHFDDFFKCLDDFEEKKEMLMNVGLVIDVGHLNITGEGLESYKPFAARIKAFHFSDNLGKHDKGEIRDPHRVVGDGNIDWVYVMKFLNEYCSDSVLIIENKSIDDCIASLREIKKMANAKRKSYNFTDNIRY